MGNQRQQLKNNIAGILQSRIENVQTLLSQLKNDQEETEKGCLETKTQIQDAVDKITRQLTQRKVLLMAEINSLGQSHLSSVQTNIQNTYQILGNLQSTLCNLDSFDNSQLLKLQIPDASNLQDSSKVKFSIKADLCYGHLEKDIDNWGTLNIGTVQEEPVLEQPDFVQVLDFQDKEEELPETITSEWQNAAEVKNWLWGKLDNEADDFEMVTIDHGIDLRMCHNGFSVVPNLDMKDSVSVGTGTEMTDDCSSIVGVSAAGDIDVEIPDRLLSIDELSMWLKPKNNSAQATTQTDLLQDEPTPTPSPPLFPSEMFENPKISSTISSKSRFLDFPGLRLDPRCWLRKEPMSQFKLSTEIAMNMSEREIIPPTFAALPYPFWLSKFNTS